MTRRTMWRLMKALAVAGAVVGVARKRRTGPAGHDLADRGGVTNPIPEPSMGPSAPAPVEDSPSVAAAVDFAYVEEATEIVAPMAGTNSTQTVEVPSEPPAEAGDVTSVTAGARGVGTTTTRVLEALAQGSDMTAAEVAEVTGIARATVSSALARLARSGKVTKAQRGYRLPEAAAPASGTKGTVLAALSRDEGMTAGDVVAATGLARGTVSTTLSRLLKTGEVVKASRGYRLPR